MPPRRQRLAKTIEPVVEGAAVGVGAPAESAACFGSATADILLPPQRLAEGGDPDSSGCPTFTCCHAGVEKAKRAAVAKGLRR
jgi:hypothetical protein